jgi:DeoR family transcriptional regulator of aga operon
MCKTGEIHILITDTGATDAMIAPFLERGIEVLRV